MSKKPPIVKMHVFINDMHLISLLLEEKVVRRTG